MGRKLDTVVSVILIGAIVTGSVVVLDSHFGLFRGDQTPDPSPPTYVSGWEGLTGNGMTAGSLAAPIQVIEFIDLQCPACRAFNLTIEKIRKRFGGELAITYINMPMPYHPHAMAAARAAVCAADQGKVATFVNEVYRHADRLGQQAWGDYAVAAGVPDSVEFDQCIKDTSEVALVAAGLRLSDSLGITGTPTLIINGWKFESGGLSERYLVRFINDLKRGRLPGDTARSSGPRDPEVVTFGTQRVYRHSTDAFGRAPELHLTPNPVAVAGGTAVPAEFDLTSVRAVALLGDGGILAAAGDPTRLLLFSATGEPQRILASEGEGPG
jgi:predicted DsbA family dithiol-disulfide isomerase